MATVEAIASALRECGHEAALLGGGRTFLKNVMATPVDLVFNIAEGWNSRSREAQVPAVCELLSVAYTHSEPLTLAISLDKAMTKRIASASGVRTPEFVCVDSMEEFEGARFPAFPVLAKPACEGSSMGIRTHSRCENREELRALVTALLGDYAGTVLIERYLPGVEVTVLVMGQAVAGMMEIAPRSGSAEAFVYSLEAKRDYANRVDYHVPPRLSSEACRAIGETALKAYRAIGCRDIGRVDLRLDEAGEPSLIEVNPLPGLHPVEGDVPVLWGKMGRSYVELIRSIVDEAALRV
jgi:D-alanine-D-alanine ligase